MQRLAFALGFSIALASASHLSAQVADRAILTVDRIITSDDFHLEGFGPARWLNDGSGYTTLETGAEGRELVKHDPATGRREVIVAKNDLIPEGAKASLDIADYNWSKDGKKLLLFTNTRKVWRLNTRGDYWVLDLQTRKLTKVGGDAPEASLMFGKFSPDGSRVAYVCENNLYVQDLSDRHVIQLTSDGSDETINGTFDWVYEEELSLRDGFRWSPDGTSIAYWQSNTSGMKNYYLINTTDNLYPTLTAIRYPKVGQTNPAVRVGVVRLEGGTTRWINVPGDPRDNYIARMEWAGPSHLVLQHLNRLQNTDDVLMADVASGTVHTLLSEKDAAWVDVVDDVYWVNENKHFLWTSERDGWRHVYLMPREAGEPRLITPGAFDVIDVLRVDESSNAIDYIASPDDPKSRYLFRVQLDGLAKPVRFTPADQTGTHGYDISPDGRWAFHTYSTFTRPPVVELVSLPDHHVVRTLVANDALRGTLDALRPTPTEFFRIEIGDGVALDGWCIKPPDFDASKKYPLLIHVYGEPAGQTVLDQWGGRNALWHRMMAQRGYIIVSVDNRGTPAPRGRDWRKSIYRQIGILASKDQAAALRALEAKWPFIDAGRVGIWGWSGGGSMSLNAIFRYPELYQTAIAIAFISDQTLYDTIYQERYMGLPSGNPDGYRDGSPITFANQLRGNLLLIHGTGDDNCHYQSCERLVNALISANKPFSMIAYPNRTHAINEGHNTSRHLYETMTRFLEANLPAGPR